MYCQFTPLKTQHGAGVSLAAYCLGLVALAASLFFSKAMFHYDALNPMEAVYVTSLVVFALTSCFLFSNTWQCCQQGSTVYEDYQPASDAATADLAKHLPPVQRSKLAGNLTPEQMKQAVEAIRSRNDVMTYLGIRKQFRYTLLFACLSMTGGIITLAIGLSRTQLSFFAMAACAITPIVSTLTYNQRLVGNWTLNQWTLDEKIDWFCEILLLALVIAGVCLFETWQRNGVLLTTSMLTYKQADSAVHLILVGSILSGIGLGLFKKIANSDVLAGPRFLTVYMFFVSLTFIMLAPWFKYPYVAHQMRQEAEIAIDQRSAYYDDRGMTIAYFFVNGILITVIGFAILNALQHPDIKESVLNIWGYFIPTIICFILDKQVYAVVIPSSCLVVAIVTFVLITAFNLLKTFNITPICC